MRFAVVGAGAIGGYLGARLALAGEDVTFVVRGKNLQALRENGIRLIEADGTERQTSKLQAVSFAESVPCDMLLLAVKAHQVSPIAADVRRLLGPNTSVLTLQNGIPWWYFYKHGGALEGQVVRSVDPGGDIATHIENERIIGSVVYPASELVAPGVIRVIEGNRFTLGEPDGSRSERVQALAQRLINAGFKAPVITDLRNEIWLKLWGNLIFNPVSALSHATLAGICGFPPTRQLAVEVMQEAAAIAERLGVRFRVSIERRIEGAAAVGEHKTSMLQDLEAGRPLELDALMGSVLELARLVEVPTPHMDTVYAVTSLLARTLADNGARLKLDALPAGGSAGSTG